MRILVVEDEQALNELLVKQLQAAHYSVDGCLTGSDALDYLLGAEYDAVVLVSAAWRCCGACAPRATARR